MYTVSSLRVHLVARTSRKRTTARPTPIPLAQKPLTQVCDVHCLWLKVGQVKRNCIQATLDEMPAKWHLCTPRSTSVTVLRAWAFPPVNHSVEVHSLWNHLVVENVYWLSRKHDHDLNFLIAAYNNLFLKATWTRHPKQKLWPSYIKVSYRLIWNYEYKDLLKESEYFIHQVQDAQGDLFSYLQLQIVNVEGLMLGGGNWR